MNAADLAYFNTLALTGSPYQWAVAAVIAVAVFAPRFLPLLARLFGMEVRRRIGFPINNDPKRIVRDRATVVEVIPPQPRIPEAAPRPPAIDLVPIVPAKRIWRVAGIVAVSLAVLLWFLLRPR